jgi:hypothetical protein
LLAATAVTICLLALAAVLRLRAPVGHPEIANRPKPEAQKSAEVVAKPLTAAPAIGHLLSPKRSDPAVGTTAARADASDGFIALPGFDPAMASGELEVVRMELPSSELRMLGAPVVGDWSDQPVLADFITDRDGTPYAVRLVQ